MLILNNSQDIRHPGWSGLKHGTDWTNNHTNYYELGYRLIKKYWGQGIATETVIALLNYTFDKLKANEVCAMADCMNDGSNKILRKVGLNFLVVSYFERETKKQHTTGLLRGAGDE